MKFDPVVQDNKYYNVEYPPTMIPVKFNNGNNNLLGTYFVSQGSEPKPTVILFHGFPGNEINFDIAHSIRRNKMNVFVFHYSGAWGSEGNYSWQNCLNDTKHAIDFVKNCDPKKFRNDPDRILTVGHSLGGFASFYNAAHHPEIKNIAWLAGFNFGFFANFIKDVEEFKNITLNTMEPSTEFVKGTSAKTLLDEMIANADEWNLINHVEKFSGKNVLMVAAEYDTVAPNEIHFDPFMKELEKLSSINLETKRLDAGHSFASKRIELQRTIINWLNKIEW